MQTMYATFGGRSRVLKLPNSEDAAFCNVSWGRFDAFCTPAYWAGQVWQSQNLGLYANLRLGSNLREEAAACLLGGYGMPAELGIAAYEAVRAEGLLNAPASAEQYESVLRRPLNCHGQLRRYRFPVQKSRYLSRLSQLMEEYAEPERDSDLRNGLAKMPGIGPKTASWIVRNYRDSNCVAIIDVHIMRAGREMGIFPKNLKPDRKYKELEQIFLAFADAINVPAAILDAIIWDHMRFIPNSVISSGASSSNDGAAERNKCGVADG